MHIITICEFPLIFLEFSKHTLDIDDLSAEDELLMGQDDILLSPCQADHFRAQEFNITDDVVLNGDGEGSDPCEEDGDNFAPRAYAVMD